VQVLNSAEYYLPLYFQAAKEASPLRSGVLLLPLILTEALTGVGSGVYIHQIGRYTELIWVGVILLTIGNGLYIHMEATTPLGVVAAFQVISGLGVGLLVYFHPIPVEFFVLNTKYAQFDPPYIALQALVSQSDIATATATLGSMRNIGVSLSIVIGGVIFQNGMQIEKSKLATSGISADLVAKLSGPDAATNIGLIPKISDPAQQLVVKQAFAWSLRNLWILCSGMAALGLIAAALVTQRELSKEHTETTTGIQDVKKNATAQPADASASPEPVTGARDIELV
jgi:hypothetical protein